MKRILIFTVTLASCTAAGEPSVPEPSDSIQSGVAPVGAFKAPVGAFKAPVEEPELFNGTKVHEMGSRDKQYKVVCYFTSWAQRRPGEGKYEPEDIDARLCTHIIYAFANLDDKTLEINSRDNTTDIDNGFYVKVSSLSKKGVKVLLGMGGWRDSKSDKYSRLVNSPEARARFINQAEKFIEAYSFVGLDLDWEYPKCWQGDCKRGPASDRDGFAALVRELKAVFKRRQWLLSAAEAHSNKVVDQAYDVRSLSENLDWISLMAYNYNGLWSTKTGHPAPLYYHEGDSNKENNVNSSIQYWLDKGVAREKLVVGIPLYGKSFTLTNPNRNGLNAPITGGGRPGKFTGAFGVLSFYEICKTIFREKWGKIRVKDESMGPYAFKGDQWVSYDDVSDIIKKGEMIKKLGLGSGMIWALDFDDFGNVCNCGAYPLLTALNATLNGVADGLIDCT